MRLAANLEEQQALPLPSIRTQSDKRRPGKQGSRRPTNQGTCQPAVTPLHRIDPFPFPSFSPQKQQQQHVAQLPVRKLGSLVYIMVDRQDNHSAPDKAIAAATGREEILTPPAACHTAQRPHRDDDDARSTDNDLDALELRNIATQDDDEAGFSTESISSGEYRIRTHRTVSRTTHSNREHTSKGLAGHIRRFWTRNVVLTVPQKSNRDHFDNHELIHSPTITQKECKAAADISHYPFSFRANFLSLHSYFALGFYEVGIPLAVSCYGVAILIAAMGAYRFWKQQNVVALGTVYAGGWELNCIGVLIGL
ncbi:hypothetical protein AnigIFM49718_008115 [Aspergillus niger]|nr:hypothetical protein AnigIFM49718_008115 [Aspergillus niger]